MNHIAIHPEVDDALRLGRPVVALETAVVTTGLPRENLADAPGDSKWRGDHPMNLEIALLMQRLVRDWSAVPATVAVLDGVLHVGLEEEQLLRLAREVQEKVSVTGLAAVMADGGSAGTTVSATLAACRLTPEPIRVFATGGIGGVHRDWTTRLDVSADLRQMAVTPTCVVCAGAKSILDVSATLEALEALGVPVISYGADHFPLFQSLGTSALLTPRRMDDVATIARTCRLQWEHLAGGRAHGCGGGVLVAHPVPAEHAVDNDELANATQQAEQAAVAAGHSGAMRTPFLLSEVARLTHGRSLRANIALLANNAQLAGELACAIAGIE